MVVDGIPEDQIKEIMENEIYGIEERHHVGANIFKTAGTSAPTLGVLGGCYWSDWCSRQLRRCRSIGAYDFSCLCGNTVRNLFWLCLVYSFQFSTEFEIGTRSTSDVDYC